MITSQQIQNLTLEDYCFLHDQSMIYQETEKIIGRVLEEQFLMKKNILLYTLHCISESYHIPILQSIKKRLLVSSIYIQNKILYIDWSLID